MKKITCLLSLMLATVFCATIVSCSDDDDDPSIVGTWYGTPATDLLTSSPTISCEFGRDGTIIWTTLSSGSQKKGTYKFTVTGSAPMGTLGVVSVVWDDGSTQEMEISALDGNGMTLSIGSFTMYIMSRAGSNNNGSDVSGKSIPAGLVGTWYRTSGGSDKYSMEFTFSSDGACIGIISHNNIPSYSSFVMKATYNNGTVTCKGTRVSVDMDGTKDTSNATIVFKYSGSTLTLTDATNTMWLGSVLTKE